MKYNCIVVDDEITAREVIISHLEKIENITVVAECKNAVEAFSALNSQKVDFLFLDINMPEINGLSFAKIINKEIKIIFTTAHREFAFEGFELNAIDYLLKPISFERFSVAINKLVGLQIELNSNKPFIIEKNDFIFVRSNRKMIKINLSEILFIESLNDNIKIHLTDSCITTRETISNLVTKLPNKDFIRVHRSFIVAINKIETYSSETIILNNTQIPVSRSYKKEVLYFLENM